jgi:hypothetical protein
MDQSEFKPEQTARYSHEGNQYRVVVIENQSDSRNIKYRLKVQNVVSSDKSSLEIGDEFECEKLRDCSGKRLWKLLRTN